MGTIIQESTELETLTCGECGITLAVPSHWLKQRRDAGGGYVCPNGHSRVFRKAENERLREELAAMTNQRDIERRQRQESERSVTALRGQVTKAKKRVGVGVCPCCNRSFTALRRHMQTKHPDYKEGKTCA